MIADQYTTKNYIHSRTGEVPRTDTGPLIPRWQSYPLLPFEPPFNRDGRDVAPMSDYLDTIVKEHKVAIGTVPNFPLDESDPDSVQEAQERETKLGYVLDGETWSRQPLIPIYYPIFNDTGETVSLQDNKLAHKVVGIFSVTLFWKDFIENILPDGVHALILVLENACGQVFSFEIFGDLVKFLGPYDGHDRTYDGLAKEVDFSELLSLASDSGEYLGLPVSNAICGYTVKIFPSNKMENDLIFSVSAAMIFVFTTLVFVIYDACVERRQVSRKTLMLDKRASDSRNRVQRSVMRSALQTSAIVSSLFPSNVRDRILPTKSQSEEKGKLLGPDHSLWRFGNGDKKDQSSKNDSPIADLFPSCTVLVGSALSW